MAAGFKTATVNASDVAATLTDYPTYVDLSRLGITTLAEAESVRVYADEAKTTEWAREIVSVSEMHVKVPSLTTTTDIYVDWDGVSADYGVADTYGRNAVWSDYLTVLHLEDYNSGTLVSSTGDNDGTASGMVAGDIAAGGIGNAFFGDQSNNHITLPTTDFVGISSYSVTAYAQRTTSGAGWLGGIYQAGGAFRKLYWAIPAAIGDTCFYGRKDATESYQAPCTIAPAIDTWSHFVWKDDNAGRDWYLNGTNGWNDSTASLAPVDRTSEDEVGVGGVKYSSALNNMANQPDISEFRITTTVLSADWVTTESNNLNDETTFWGTWADAGGATNAVKSINGISNV